MASIATTIPTTKRTTTVGWGRYALVGLGTILAAVLANVGVYFLGGLVVTYDPQFPPLVNVSGAIIFTVIPALVAVLLYAALLRFARRPERSFTITAVLALLISLIPDLIYIPGVPGATGPQTAILILMHLVAAAIITAMLTRFGRQQDR